MQAILYTVALHRYLRWRLPATTRPSTSAACCTCSLRGMSGPDHPVIAGQPCGVFAWQPPVALIEALSELFEHGRRAA